MTDETKMREAFERLMLEKGFNVELDPDGAYKETAVLFYWRGFCLAVAYCADYIEKHGAESVMALGWGLTGRQAEQIAKALASKLRERGISKCPQCGGEADNGHDRCLPPNPYVCTKCEKEGV